MITRDKPAAAATKVTAALCLMVATLVACRNHAGEPVAGAAAGSGSAAASASSPSAEQRLERLADEVAAAVSAAAVASAAASATASATASAAVPTNATPDNAVRRYWALLDENEIIRRRLFAFQALVRAPLWRRFEAIVQPGLFASTHEELYPVLTFSRQIESATIETPSRAIVTAVVRNVTPLPAEFTLLPAEQSMKSNGERFRYVLTNPGDGWRIESVSSVTLGMSVEIWRDRLPSQASRGVWRGQYIQADGGG